MVSEEEEEMEDENNEGWGRSSLNLGALFWGAWRTDRAGDEAVGRGEVGEGMEKRSPRIGKKDEEEEGRKKRGGRRR